MVWPRSNTRFGLYYISSSYIFTLIDIYIQLYYVHLYSNSIDSINHFIISLEMSIHRAAMIAITSLFTTQKAMFTYIFPYVCLSFEESKIFHEMKISPTTSAFWPLLLWLLLPFGFINFAKLIISPGTQYIVV